MLEADNFFGCGALIGELAIEPLKNRPNIGTHVPQALQKLHGEGVGEGLPLKRL